MIEDESVKKIIMSQPRSSCQPLTPEVLEQAFKSMPRGYTPEDEKDDEQELDDGKFDGLKE